MEIINSVKNIAVSPKTAWQTIEANNALHMRKIVKTTAKLLLSVCVLSMTLSFVSCSKWIEDLINDKIEIPGLGNSTDALTGEAFKFPDGVEVTGEITGTIYGSSYWSFAFPQNERSMTGSEIKSLPVRLRADETTPINYKGSSCGYVDLLIPLRNTRSTPVEVTIPAATIIVSRAGNTQNGVLIKKVVFTIAANSEYHLCLSMYCGNLSRGTAGLSDVYVLGVVSDAKPLLELCDLVKNKKINIEEFNRSNSSDQSAYNEQTDKLQHIVWNVTDFTGITNSDKSYINSLPNSN